MRKDQLQEYLKKHCVGKKRVVSAGTLALALNMHEKELRKLVNRLRREGVPIASGREGYYYASNAGEVYATIRSLRKMAAGLDAAICGLETALEQFVGDDD